MGFACYEGEREYKLRDLLADVRSRAIAFSSGRRAASRAGAGLLRRHGLPAVSLGRRILRTETAGLYVLSAISAILE
ncbi:MAG: 16S rRNA (uracil(1498)-N(3))-methyltransferase [Acutalibacteraceae bacterium]